MLDGSLPQINGQTYAARTCLASPTSHSETLTGALAYPSPTEMEYKRRQAGSPGIVYLVVTEVGNLEVGVMTVWLGKQAVTTPLMDELTNEQKSLEPHKQQHDKGRRVSSQRAIGDVAFARDGRRVANDVRFQKKIYGGLVLYIKAKLSFQMLHGCEESHPLKELANSKSCMAFSILLLKRSP
ncbi:uncharacterized protein BDR25DRAFT_351913 [Lindgomyces ingoldianus]|uniref:Uncharacterized protein n=1 Tax=Lindgomyces ingoldianus TaxID=673940 RepID=A0ACB6R5E0_9PLEO|nr:uncharacterized protein BDR25DRAFT_351913 [Lindgomyces ingoldianus]KAF2474371.1 hypothetical protein BDR25DRAFT_351913 [Lindgomyces ingoldianus]